MRRVLCVGLNVLTKITHKYREYILVKYENHIRCTRCKKLIHASHKYCMHCSASNIKRMDVRN